MIKIDKDVPIPEPAKGPTKYPWASMEIGDSFFAPVKVTSVSGLGTAHKRTGYKFVSRKVEGGIRVWRVA